MKTSQYCERVAMLWLLVLLSMDVDATDPAWRQWIDVAFGVVALGYTLAFTYLARRAREVERQP